MATAQSPARTRELTTTIGTGNILLAGAVSKHQTFTASLAAGTVFPYTIEHQTLTEWEHGIGTMVDSTHFARTTVIASSNAGALVNFSAGTKDCYVPPSPLTLGSGLFQWFGDGFDGDLTISSGTTTLASDKYYRNLTISGTGKLATAGFRVFVAGILDLSAAPANAIDNSGGVGATSAAGAAGGAGGGAGTTGGGGAGGTGAINTSPGTQAAAPTNQTPANGGAGGANGAGGSGSGGAGGAQRTGATVSAPRVIHRPLIDLTTDQSFTLLKGGAGGAGSSSGDSGGGTTAQEGGGGGGGGVVQIMAATLARSASTAASAISATGGAGGATGGAPGTNSGGPSGAGGGGGGWIWLLYGILTGAAATNTLDASGGAGSNGGDGIGTGVGGDGGTGGSGGRVTVLALQAGTLVETFGGAGTAGTAHSGVTHGNGGAGNSVKVSL